MGGSASCFPQDHAEADTHKDVMNEELSAKAYQSFKESVVSDKNFVKHVARESVQYALSTGVVMGIDGEFQFTHCPFTLFPSYIKQSNYFIF